MFDTNERFDAGFGILDTDHDAPLRIGYYLLRLMWHLANATWPGHSGGTGGSSECVINECRG